ncbi:hypothetical protein KFZ70_13940 [Tamlana fucoidanivorans]|uniref:Uncharacterized protein n=1 Tax=Allotamlana fucoidanivorans TaxID=2583814 RepID=A0A5C4SQE5_9FLAO|nr:hypothetical protein [Tamlana fucoidanivorans]TNJ46528.1 hypothetical protein FGF67_02555 [Tamlana fucoidanivorans]
MKNFTKLLLILCFVAFSCQNENVNSEQMTEQDLQSFDVLTTTCTVIDADRCYITGQPSANFWWPNLTNNNDYFNPTTYFGSDAENGVSLSFMEYPDGTAHISGTTINSTGCLVTVDVYLKDKMDWTTWSDSFGNNGQFKDESPNNCSNIDKETLSYYVIDPEKSTITATGGSCYEEGTYDVIQRPDADDPNTPHFGIYVGTGGANFHGADPDAYGLSGWGWMIHQETGNKYVMDFNFATECRTTGSDCETAFARGNDGNICFIDEGFSNKRWGWRIVLPEPGEYSFEVYAGAGQCDISKGVKVGTVDVTYANGTVEVVYNIDEGYELRETHVYAGKADYPTNKKGKKTVAPGQYTIGTGLEGAISIIVHAVVCN